MERVEFMVLIALAQEGFKGSRARQFTGNVINSRLFVGFVQHGSWWVY